MSLPIIFGALAVLIVGVLAASLRARGGSTGAGRQSVVIMVVLVAVVALVLFYAFGR